MLAHGVVLADRFRIEDVAARGGMGAIYRARDLETGATVAVKVLTHLGSEAPRRFHREAEVLASLRHPAVVRYIASGVDAGAAYLVMEWLEGEDLAARLRNGPLTVQQTVIVLRKLAEALSVAHRAGVVHRDIKPANVFLRRNHLEDAVLIDFGVALPLTRPPVSQIGLAIGTPGYMAPEQAQGTRVDTRADVFAVGCVAYRCLAGHRPFQGSDPVAILMKTVICEIVPLGRIRSDVSPELDALVARLLSRSPDDRPSDGTALLRAVRDLEDAGPLSARASMPLTLGTAERRLQCVVTVRFQPGEDAAAIARSSSTLSLELERLDGVLHTLVDGSWFVEVDTSGAATDHAARAARCALAVHDALPEAVVAIEALRRDVDGAEPSTPRNLGDDRDVTMPSLEPVDGVRIDETVAGLLETRFVVEHDGRGLVLRSERVALPEPRRVLGRVVPFVGREHELRALVAMYELAASERTPAAVVISGAPGVGKSRLRRELVARIREHEPRPEVWIARADPVNAGSAFALAAQLVSTAAGLRASDDETVRRRKLRARLFRNLAGDRLDRVERFVGEIVGIESAPTSDLRAARRDPNVMHDQISRAWQEWLAAEAAKSPLVVVLEDLHWGDLPSVRLFDGALGALKQSPLFVLAVARPELHAVFPRLWEGRHVQMTTLRELSDRAADSIVRAVLGADVSATVAERLVARASGNPFYLEELIRAADVNQRDLPDTVRAMLEARLASLDPDQRRILRAASIFGESFSKEGVRTLLGMALGIDEIDAHLAELVRREIIEADRDGRFAGAYRFRHSLLREAAYGMLTPNDAKAGHRLAAEWLLSIGQEDALALAEQLRLGGRRGLAAAYYLRAGRKALDGLDLGGALRCAEAGIASGADGEVLGGLRLIAARVYSERDLSAAALESARSAFAAFPTGSTSWHDSVLTLVHIYGVFGARPELRELADALLSCDVTDAVFVPYAVAAHRLVAWMLVLGERDRADRLEHRLAGLCATRSPLDLEVVARQRQVQAVELLLSGDLEQLVEVCTEAAALFDRLGDRRWAANERRHIAYAWNLLGQPERAIAQIDETLPIVRALGLHALERICHDSRGTALFRARRFAEARSTFETAISQAGDNPRVFNSCRLGLARVALSEHAIDEAKGHADAVLQSSPIPAQIATAHTLLAFVALAHGDAEDAVRSAMTAREVMAQASGESASDTGNFLTDLALIEALVRAGDTAAARKHAAEATAQLSARADRIKSSVLRASFLAIQEHAELLRIAGELGV